MSWTCLDCDAAGDSDRDAEAHTRTTGHGTNSTARLRLLDTEQAAAALDVPARLIRLWRHRGKVVPAGLVPASVPGGMQPLYRLEELQPLADAYHQSRSDKD